MNLRLLGTGAADGIPSFFGDDPVSRYARTHGGKDVRTRSAAIVDNTLKIDFGPDTFAQVQRYGLTPHEWTALLFTHSDDDHLTPSELQYALFPFTEHDHLPFPIYGNAAVLQRIRTRFPEWPMELIQTDSFRPVPLGDYTVTPVRANHIPHEDCQNLLIEREERRLLYATDTGMFAEETFGFLRGRALDVLVLECTNGFCVADYEGHLGIAECIEVVARLRQDGALTSNARVVTTHHGANGLARHCELEEALQPHGIEPGYDGMLIEV